jgi:5'-3' exonuclease
MWSILALLGDPDEQVTHIAAAFDNPIRSFRNDLFAGYKTDAGVPPELLAQFDRVERATRALGVVVWSMAAFEADDAIATAAARWSNDVDETRIVSPDKDFGQCLRGSRVVLVDRVRKRVIDEATLLQSRGIAPGSVPDYLALVGDTADGIPGLAGFGEKTAATLLREYGHLESIPLRGAAWNANIRGAASLAATLSANMDRAILYRRLATLDLSVPLSQSLDDLEWQGIPAHQFDEFCDEIRAPEALRKHPMRVANVSG